MSAACTTGIAAWLRMASYAGHWQLRGYGFWALEEKASGAFAGYCGLWYPEGWPEREIGWGLMPAFRRPRLRHRGGAARARPCLRGSGVDDARLLRRNPENHASAHVAQRLGARRDGTFDLRGAAMDIWRHPDPRRARSDVRDGPDIIPETPRPHTGEYRHVPQDPPHPRRREEAPPTTASSSPIRARRATAASSSASAPTTR